MTEPRDAPGQPTGDRRTRRRRLTSTRVTCRSADPIGSAAEAELRTFLIADIRGYTTYTSEQGADAAADLAKRFAAIVREVVVAHDGFLLELRGDEALAVFVSGSARAPGRARAPGPVRRRAAPRRRASDSTPARPSRSKAGIAARPSTWRPDCAARPGPARHSRPRRSSTSPPRSTGSATPTRGPTGSRAWTSRSGRSTSSRPSAGRRNRSATAGTTGSDRRVLAVLGLGLVAVALVAGGLTGAFGLIGTGARSPGPSGDRDPPRRGDPSLGRSVRAGRPATARVLRREDGSVSRTPSPIRSPLSVSILRRRIVLAGPRRPQVGRPDRSGHAQPWSGRSRSRSPRSAGSTSARRRCGSPTSARLGSSASTGRRA